ncbi:pleckstrin homology domain-containing family B member 2 [Xiphophorus hellerii]|uniref:pleckstrin homology domain-containing family B member 2 n=1 Tax=Xiphophorus hellerii TaxID=8084 RepID=UPI0013B45981|nr:pleckstrin homology domain-containing family B member 2-like [Xiphophorus hellerii]
MSTAGVHRGFLRKYGGFMFKQWKEKYLVLTMEGSLLVCRDAESPPDQVVALQSNCESIAEGREILDLPRLPPGGRRDCCFALILPQNKFLLLLSDNPDDCILWLKLIRKVREGVMSPLTLQRQQSLTPCITDREPLPDSSSDKEPGSPRVAGAPPPLSRVIERGGSFRDRQPAPGPRQPLRSNSVAPPHRVSDCLRHGNSSDARAVRAVCLLMGGAAASSALGYLSSCSPSSPLASRAPGRGPRLRGLLRSPRRRLLPRLQPGRRLPAFQHLRL